MAVPGSLIQGNGCTSTSYHCMTFLALSGGRTSTQIVHQITTPPLYRHWSRSTSHQSELGTTPHHYSNGSSWLLDMGEWLHIHLAPFSDNSSTSVNFHPKLANRSPHLHWIGTGGGLLPTKLRQGLHLITFLMAVPGSLKRGNGCTSTSHPVGHF